MGGLAERWRRDSGIKARLLSDGSRDVVALLGPFCTHRKVLLHSLLLPLFGQYARNGVYSLLGVAMALLVRRNDFLVSCDWLLGRSVPGQRCQRLHNLHANVDDRAHVGFIRGLVLSRACRSRLP